MASATVLLSILAAISWCAISSQAASVELVPPEDGRANLDASFTYTCRVDGGVATSIEWYHNSTLVGDVSSDSTELMVEKSVREDAGEYYCRVVFSDGSVVTSNEHTLELRGVFSIQVEPTGEILLGSRVQFRCTVDAVPPPRSVFFDKLRDDGNFRREATLTLENGSNTAVLDRNIAWTDNGTWRCGVTHTVPADEKNFEITVLAPPTTTVSLGSNSIATPLLGSDIVLECHTESSPASSLTWTLNDIHNITELSQESGSRYELLRTDHNLTEFTSRLTVRAVTYGDSGTYTCTGTNRLGTDSDSISVSVEGSPSIQIDPPTSPLRVGLSSSFYLHCPFIGHPPPSITWKRGQTSLTHVFGRYYSYTNGSLLVSNVESIDSDTFTCSVSNRHGSDSRTFTVMVIERPDSPTNLEVTPLDNDNRAVRLTWRASADNSPNKDVEEYVVEWSIEGREFEESGHVFESEVTTGLLRDLLPGVSYVFRLRASNTGGLSEPSNQQIYAPPSAPPLLSHFTATALEGGRSVLLTWQLEYSGATRLNNFSVEIVSGGVVERTVELNYTLGSEIVTGLSHESSYTFLAVLVNSAGRSARFTSRANTTIAPPSKPTRPVIVSTTTTSIKISFRVKFGSQRITHFILNMTQSNNGDETQKRMSLDETRYIDSISETVDAAGSSDGLDVVVFLTGLTEREVYEFEVAAESSVGVGEFSEPSPAAKLEDDRILYYIIGSVVCCVLVVVGVIVIVAVFAFGKQRYNQRRKTLKINSSGNHAFLPEDTDNGLPIKSPTVHRQHSRDTLTSTSNGYFSGQFHATNISKSDSYSREGLSPPTYDQLGESPVPSGMTSPIGIKMDTVIDMPENTNLVQTHFVGGKVAQNPQYNLHVLGPHGSSPRPNHVQLTLQTSLSDIQHHVDSPTSDRHMGSLSSERQFLSNSHQLSIQPPVLSRSNPTIGTRYMCDSMLLPGPTSQATDV